MNKLFLGLIIFILLLLSSCLDLLNENLPIPYILFAKINADSTGYREYFEIDNMVHQELMNYVVSSDHEFIIMNYGLRGLVRQDLEYNEELKISGNRWVRSCLPDISPNNESVVFASEGDIFFVNCDGTGLTNITNTPENYDSYPSFTEDGLTIVYSSNLNYIENDSLYAIYTVIPDGSELNEICTMENEGHKIIYPLWCEQHNCYLFQYIRNNSNNDTLSGVWQYQVGSPSQIYNSNLTETKPTISSDGDKILIQSSGKGLIIDIDGNLLFDTYTIDYGIYTVFLSQDGSYLVYQDNDYVYIYKFASNESNRLINSTNKIMLVGDYIYCFVKNWY